MSFVRCSFSTKWHHVAGGTPMPTVFEEEPGRGFVNGHMLLQSKTGVPRLTPTESVASATAAVFASPASSPEASSGESSEASSESTSATLVASPVLLTPPREDSATPTDSDPDPGASPDFGTEPIEVLDDTNVSHMITALEQLTGNPDLFPRGRRTVVDANDVLGTAHDYVHDTAFGSARHAARRALRHSYAKANADVDANTIVFLGREDLTDIMRKLRLEMPSPTQQFVNPADLELLPDGDHDGHTTSAGVDNTAPQVGNAAGYDSEATINEEDGTDEDGRERRPEPVHAPKHPHGKKPYLAHHSVVGGYWSLWKKVACGQKLKEQVVYVSPREAFRQYRRRRAMAKSRRQKGGEHGKGASCSRSEEVQSNAETR